GGNGAVVSMKPMGFLLDDGKTCRMLRVSEEPLDNLIEHASDLIQSLTAENGEE
ncbi:MAG: GerW family sporulation protein, partial [Clostridia bacterium]|nr:GerW family sporulation protein [Clostridia bacterium]